MASTTTIVVIFSSSIHSLRLTYQVDIAKVQEQLSNMQVQQMAFQSAYADQLQSLTKLVSSSVNATDEFITNFTTSVNNATQTIQSDMATVQDLQQNQNSALAVEFAGMFTILVILVSGYHLSTHLRHMNLPIVQRKIMAVLYMTPLYAITSCLSLVFTTAEPYLAVIREFYEAYCVYMFLSFLIAVLGRGDRQAVITLLELRADKLSRPDKCRCGPKAWNRLWQSCRRRCCCFCSSNKLSSEEDHPITTTTTTTSSVDEFGNYIGGPDRIKAEAVLDQCQRYCMQFVLLRPVTAIAWLISNQLIVSTQFLDVKSPQLYIMIVSNISIFFALRGLVKFYHATRTYLAWCDPWPKFLMLKGVVFLTFWQKMVLSLVVNVAFPTTFDTQEEADEFVLRAQNFLICLEMLFCAVAHCFVFPTEEWVEGYREKEEARREREYANVHAFGDSVALGDFLNDIKTVILSKQGGPRTIRQRRKVVEGLSPSRSSDRREEDGSSTTNTTIDSSLALTESRGGDDDDDDEDGDYDDDEFIVQSPNSVESDDVDRAESISRIERFINQHTTSSPTKKLNVDDTKEIV